MTSNPAWPNNRAINTSDTMKGNSRGFPCDKCGKLSKVLYRRANSQNTCTDCTPADQQFIEVLEN